MRLALALALWISGSLAATAVADDPPDFDRDVAPILTRRCLDCHSGAEPKGTLDLSRHASALKGGLTGPAVVPGEPDESWLWIQIEDGVMPPKTPLEKDEAEILRAWIASGARWGSDPIDPYAATTDHRAGREWWSIAPLHAVSPPDSPGQAEDANPIDALLRARLQEAGLRPVAEADRRVLVRRLSFDLTGLPPTPEEVEAFVEDDRPDAYERLVDRTLASPQYGVRWARAWLDLARFGESNGFEHDEFRPDAWRYRDWVVRAFNEDLPYDEFARLQLAGDVLRPDDLDAIEATGFLVAGSYDTVGQQQQSEAMRRVVREDELEDLVGTVGQTFLGLTVHCARCHDHKFDPILQSDYYRMASLLDGVRHGVRDLTNLDPEALAARTRLNRRAARLAEIENQAREHLKRPGPDAPVPIARWEFGHGASDLVGGLSGELRGAARLEPGGLRVDGASGYLASAPLTVDLRARTLEAWVRLDNLDQRGGGVLSLQTLDGQAFDAIVFGEQEPGVWMAGSESFVRSRSFAAPAEREADHRVVQIVIVYEADGTVAAYRDGQPYGTPYRVAGPREFKAGESQILFGLRHGQPDGNRLLAGTIARASLYDRALRPEEVAAAFDASRLDESTLASALTPELLREREQIRAEIPSLRDRASAPHRAYAVTPRPPGITHRLVRGDPRQPAEVIAPGGLSALAPILGDQALDPEAPDGERRALLARWITRPDNPLFARVIVNRVWRSHFGTGLVETPSDLGFNGGEPSHPDLLDWLARDLIEHGWSLKHLHQRIVTSEAYRRASRLDPEAAAVDATNRLHWRKAPQRLEAEMVRDAMLAVSGALDPTLGGPGFREFEIHKAVGTITTQYLPSTPSGPGLMRRTLYRTWARGGRSGFLDALDCPDPSTTAPVRAVTNTPLQALAMLNNALVLDLADRLAARLQREAGPDLDAQMVLAYRLAFGRAPSDAERVQASEVARRFGVAAVGRALFNSNEFLFVD